MAKLAVGNIAQIPVKITLKDGSVSKRFEFTLTAVRKSIETVRNGDISGRNFLLENITDWSGRIPVLDDNGEMATFSKENLEFMIDELLLENVLFTAYMRECGGKEKN